MLTTLAATLTGALLLWAAFELVLWAFRGESEMARAEREAAVFMQMRRVGR
jgi:hypothetical protein